jgi:peptidoglycan/LPS O-acetylase OafA/YrhL
MTTPATAVAPGQNAETQPLATSAVQRSAARLMHLDLLRVTAVMLVIGHHMAYPPHDLPAIVRKPLVLWRIGGWVGVDLFFVLSGFLVSGLLFREQQRHGRFRIGRFLLRRGFKIYPPFYFLLLATIAIEFALGELPPLGTFVPDVVFVQNYFGSHWQHTWSLAVEEHFYLLLPLLLLFMARRSSEPLGPKAFARLPLVFLVVSVVVLTLRLHALLYVTPGAGHITPTHLRIDSLMFGVLLAYIYHYHHAAFFRWFSRRRLLLGAGAVLTILLVALLPRPGIFLHTVGLSMNFLASGVLLGVLSTLPDTDNRLLRWIAYIGANSYSIYLWHEVVRRYIGRFTTWSTGVQLSWAAETALYMSLSIVVGIVLAFAVERPMLALRDRLVRSPQK